MKPGDISAEIRLKNGTVQKQEFYYGASFLSQSARFLSVADDAIAVTLYDQKGGTRKIDLQTGQ